MAHMLLNTHLSLTLLDKADRHSHRVWSSTLLSHSFINFALDFFQKKKTGKNEHVYIINITSRGKQLNRLPP